MQHTFQCPFLRLTSCQTFLVLPCYKYNFFTDCVITWTAEYDVRYFLSQVRFFLPGCLKYKNRGENFYKENNLANDCHNFLRTLATAVSTTKLLSCLPTWRTGFFFAVFQPITKTGTKSASRITLFSSMKLEM